MPNPTPINQRGPIDKPYVAGFEGKKIGLYASSLAAAKQKAVEHFKPKKRSMGLVWAELAKESK
jgi:hypothetical protein